MLASDYASPEQVRGLPTSTSADIYAVGAALYELFANSIEDLEAAVCEREPISRARR